MRRLCILASLVLAIPACQEDASPSVTAPVVSPKVIGEDLPFLAIWRAYEGRVTGSMAPYLRVALWDDGRVVFAKDPTIWDHELREGRIDIKHISSLKQALLTVGVFDLAGYCYLVPDAPMDCVLVRINGQEQILYWDEVEAPSYGINIDPQQRHRDFIEAWKNVNNTALSYLPDDSSPSTFRFQSVPDTWYVKPAIQSR